MTDEAIIQRWHSLTPAERDEWVRRIVFPKCSGNLSFEESSCPSCGYDGLWGENSWGEAQPYTQHPAAAWLVVERMREQGWRLRLNGWQPSGWTVQFDHSNSWAKGKNDADELPEAICLAALLALGGEKADMGTV